MMDCWEDIWVEGKPLKRFEASIGGLPCIKIASSGWIHVLYVKNERGGLVQHLD
jgi:hypothetical protein